MKKSITRKIEDLLSAMVRGSISTEIKEIVRRTTLETNHSTHNRELKVKLIQLIH
jgi:hypothetical protein